MTPVDPATIRREVVTTARAIAAFARIAGDTAELAALGMFAARVTLAEDAAVLACLDDWQRRLVGHVRTAWTAGRA